MATGESRRQSILEAMVHVVGRTGYHDAIVREVIAESEGSLTTFYKYFANKHDCFLAAYDMAAERALAAIESECGRKGTWIEQVYGGLAALVELFVAEPALARCVIVEPAVAGADARRRQLAMTSRVALSLESARGSDALDLPANTALMAVGAVTGLLFDEIQGGRTAMLSERLPDLLFALLVPFIGPQNAAEGARQTKSYTVASR